MPDTKKRRPGRPGRDAVALNLLLDRKLAHLLRGRAERTGETKTAILEAALRQYFGVK